MENTPTNNGKKKQSSTWVRQQRWYPTPQNAAKMDKYLGTGDEKRQSKNSLINLALSYYLSNVVNV